MANPKILLPVLISFSFLSLFQQSSIASQLQVEEWSKCRWVSVPVPEAIIQIQGTSDMGYIEGDLIYKGKRIRQLLFGQYNGYGSLWWAHQEDGDKPGGGGRLVPFIGNQPSRGTKRRQIDETKPMKALLVDLGSDFHYSDLRGDFDLYTAGEGLWRLGEGCFFPGR
ncbi:MULTISPECIES: hypothetical protein [Prochlorococcus]|uniref:hypothetical protein n=1 Tax=Prochlorococcus TaxID=1218 RepID=UPI0007B3A5E8|nr:MULTISPECIES: hypothetical protein [Prochlorococcus]KZR67267.1 hypothetical protein PMIT1312_00558 [Prochlorococcus marinus str. MIT 1312]NMO84128.1 hypothetical protein [Prochlorococcus sp. P1344]